VSLALSVVTPEGAVLECEVDSVVAPGQQGEFGVLPGHEAFLAPLQPGRLSARGPSGDELLVVSDGFAEVAGDRVTVLVNSAERRSDIDRERAEAARDRALARLAGRGDEIELDEQRARTALLRAELRLAILLH